MAALAVVDKWDKSRWLTRTSTPGEDRRNVAASCAQEEYPAWNFWRSSKGFLANNRRPWFILCKCLTVNSRMSAFSSLDTFSPSACSATVMMSFSSSRHLLILARRFLSRSGFVIFLYWCVRDRGTSESPELGEVVELPPAFCSGEESDAVESRVVELTLGENAENGLCQFMASCVVVSRLVQWCLYDSHCLDQPQHDYSS